MKRLVVIAEGETEESFVNDVLSPYFVSIGMYNAVQCFKTKHSNGGMSKYSYLREDILHTLYEKDVVVTTMIDLYRLPSDFPGFREAESMSLHEERVSFLERQIVEDIAERQGQVFDNLLPYIQLHEFEALVFSSVTGVEAIFDKNEYKHLEFKEVIEEFPNPEDINNGADTAPSVRLKKLIPGYDKVLFGIGIIKEAGMEVLLSKCPHFRSWITKIKDALSKS